jgi:hypothetical protein
LCGLTNEWEVETERKGKDTNKGNLVYHFLFRLISLVLKQENEPAQVDQNRDEVSKAVSAENVHVAY